MGEIKLIRYGNHKTADGEALQQRAITIPKPANSLPNFQLIFLREVNDSRCKTLSQTVPNSVERKNHTTVLSKNISINTFTNFKEKPQSALLITQQDLGIHYCNPHCFNSHFHYSSHRHSSERKHSHWLFQGLNEPHHQLQESERIVQSKHLFSLKSFLMYYLQTHCEETIHHFTWHYFLELYKLPLICFFISTLQRF